MADQRKAADKANNNTATAAAAAAAAAAANPALAAAAALGSLGALPGFGNQVIGILRALCAGNTKFSLSIFQTGDDAANPGAQQLNSVYGLIGNIQALLKMAVENAKQEERQQMQKCKIKTASHFPEKMY